MCQEPAEERRVVDTKEGLREEQQKNMGGEKAKIKLEESTESQE